MRRLPGLILLAGLLAGVAFIVLHIRPGYLGMLAALALSMPYTGRRKTFTVDERALVADVLMIEYVCVAAWLAVIVGEVPFLLASVAVQGVLAVIAGVVMLGYGLLLWWRPPMLTLTPDGLTRRVFVRSRPIPWERIAEAVTVQGAWLTLAPGVRISTVGLRVDPAYAGRTIDRFRNDPDARAAMGVPTKAPAP